MQPRQAEEGRPKRRQQQAEPRPASERPRAEGEEGQGRRRKQQQAEPQPGLQSYPQRAEGEEGQGRRRKQQQAEPQPGLQSDPQPAEGEEGQGRRRKQQQAEPQPGLQSDPQPAEGEEGQGRRRRQQQAEPQPGAGTPATEGAADAGGAGQDGRNAADLSDAELRARLQSNQRALRNKNLSADERSALEAAISGSRRELQVRRARGKDAPETAGGEPGPATRRPEGGRAEGRPVVNLPRGGEPNPAVERRRLDREADNQAGSLLADSTSADKLDDAALAAPSLHLSERARQRRHLARARARVAPAPRIRPRGPALARRRSRRSSRRGARAREPGGRLPFDDRPIIVRPPSRDEVQKIIVDRRRSRDLDQIELNRRIRVYRDIINDERYSAAEREEYIRYLENDRSELRNRLVSGRRERADRWREARDNRDFDVDVDIELEEYEGRPREVTIWAAEVDDEAIEEQLVARPLGPVPGRYTREQILSEPEAVVMAQPEVRRSVPSVELDTIHFGFNESFVREEEIANLERIGKIIEKIVAAHPNEVFMIEGHTDAVGDDDYNVELSKKRAEAVKQALTEYYVIAAENLATVGLGERYLKIPTAEEEGENRRVTLRRVTSLVQN